MRKHIRLAAWLELSSYLVRISSFQSLCVRLSSVSWHSLCLAESVSPSVKGDPSSRYFLRFSPVGHPSLPVLCPVSHTSSLSAYVLQKALQSSLKTDTVSYQLPCHLPTEDAVGCRTENGSGSFWSGDCDVIALPGGKQSHNGFWVCFDVGWGRWGGALTSGSDRQPTSSFSQWRKCASNLVNKAGLSPQLSPPPSPPPMTEAKRDCSPVCLSSLSWTVT